MPDDIRSTLEAAFAAKASGKPIEDDEPADVQDNQVDDKATASDNESDDKSHRSDKDSSAPSDTDEKVVKASDKDDQKKTPVDDTAKKPVTYAPPVKWTKEEKEAWEKMTDGLEPAEVERVNKIKSILLGRNRSMEGEFTKQMQAIATTRKAYDEISAVLEPHRAGWKAQGISDASGVKQLLDGFEFSNKNPLEFIKWIAQLRKVDLHAAFGGQQKPQRQQAEDDGMPELHPAIQRQLDELRSENQRLNGELGRFGQTFSQREQQEQSALRASANREVEAFFGATDDAGQPKYPFANELRGDMKRYLDSGAADSLEDAYDIAVYANPSTRQKLMESQALQQRRDWEAKQREDAAKAKKAAGSISPGGVAVSQRPHEEPAESGSVRGDLEAALSARLNRSSRI